MGEVTAVGGLFTESWRLLWLVAVLGVEVAPPVLPAGGTGRGDGDQQVWGRPTD